MNIPVDHRTVSLKFEQYLREQYTVAIMMPRLPEQFTNDDETYIAAYTCEVQLATDPKDILIFVIEFSDKCILFCKLDDKGSIRPIFKSDFYVNITSKGQIQNKFLEHYIKLLHAHFQSSIKLLR